NLTTTTKISTLPLHDALRISGVGADAAAAGAANQAGVQAGVDAAAAAGAQGAATAGADADRNARWRFKQHNGEWWYWTPQNQWMYHRGGQWQNYDANNFTGPRNFQQPGRTWGQYGGNVGPQYYGQYGRPRANPHARYGYRNYSHGPGYQQGFQQGARYPYGTGYRGLNQNFVDPGVRAGANVGGAIGGAIGGQQGAGVGSAIGGAIGGGVGGRR
ncbi:MAG TPA: hypothetical protein PKC18_10610, partial [Lacipirellulaceae bacterium]|nr:hypothetical protein [Lacipirellulaceae bacterium]